MRALKKKGGCLFYSFLILMTGFMISSTALAGGGPSEEQCSNQYVKVDCYNMAGNSHCGFVPGDGCYENGNCAVCGGTCQYTSSCNRNCSGCCKPDVMSLDNGYMSGNSLAAFDDPDIDIDVYIATGKGENNDQRSLDECNRNVKK